MRTLILTALAAAIALSGCAASSPPALPEMALGDSVVRQPADLRRVSAVAGGDAHQHGAQQAHDDHWWRAFGSARINQLVDTALANNPGIAAATATLHAAAENTAAQYGAYYPNLSASYSPSRQRNAVGTISPTLTSGSPLYNLHTAQLNVGYTADVFGINRNTVLTLRAQQSVAEQQLRAARLTLVANVVAAALQDAAIRAQIDAVQGLIRSAQQSVTLTRKQAAAGYASGLDVAAAETALAQAEQALPALVRQQQQTRDLLAVLSGVAPAALGDVDVDFNHLTLPSPPPTTLPSQLVRQRPDVLSAEAQVVAAHAQVGIAVANRLPQLTLNASYGSSATVFSRMFTDHNVFWSIAGSVTQPLFDFGTLRHRQHAAEAQLEASKAQYRLAVLQALQNVADALYALDADQQAITAASATESAAHRTLDLTQRQFEAGAINGLSLLTARSNWQQAHLGAIQAQATQLTDVVGLYQALGGDWQDGEDAKKP